MRLGLEMRASVRCNACSVLTPLAGIRNEVSCRGCASTLDVVAIAADAREGGITYPFGAYYDVVAEAAYLLADGDDCRDARQSQGSPVALRRSMPTCLACESALPWPEPGAPVVTCPECADQVAVRWPDDETRSWDPRIHCVVGDAKGREDPPVGREGEGATIKCGDCGAPFALVADDHKRLRACTFCGAPNYVGDAAWLALFPEPEWHRCTLLYELNLTQEMALHAWLVREEDKFFVDEEWEKAVGASGAELHARVRAAQIAAISNGRFDDLHRLAANPEVTDDEAVRIDQSLTESMRVELAPRAGPALARVFARSAFPAVRAAVAAHPEIGVAILHALATDAEAKVRAAIAAHPLIDGEVLAALRKDSSADVVAAAKQNPNYRPGFFEKLFGG